MTRRRLMRLETPPPGARVDGIRVTAGDASEVLVGVYDEYGRLIRSVPHKGGKFDRGIRLEAGQTVYVAVKVPGGRRG